MQVYLPIAEMTVPAEFVLLLGVFVGFLSGVFGVGGGFMTTPFLIFFGLPPAIAVGTQACQLVATSTTGVLGHWRRGHVDFRMGAVMLTGGIAGSALGTLIFRGLQTLGQIDLVIAILYIFLLGSIGFMMLAESLAALMRKGASDAPMSGWRQSRFIRGLPWKVRFTKSRLYISALVPAGIGFVGGLLVSIMGIGGGFLLVPAMIYILGMPPLLVAGTSLFQIMVTTAVSTVLHATTSHTVDLVLATLLIAGSVVGAHLGVRASRMIRGVQARIILAILVLAVSVELAASLLIRPAEVYVAVLR